MKQKDQNYKESYQYHRREKLIAASFSKEPLALLQE